MPSKEEMAQFANAIEEIVLKTDYNYLEAITYYCETTGLEIEVAATLINPNLKSKIQRVAMDHNLLKVKTSRLPI